MDMQKEFGNTRKNTNKKIHNQIHILHQSRRRSQRSRSRSSPRSDEYGDSLSSFQSCLWRTCFALIAVRCCRVSLMFRLIRMNDLLLYWRTLQTLQSTRHWISKNSWEFDMKHGESAEKWQREVNSLFRYVKRNSR